ncbi:MAG TPA: glycine cleavage system aminomethyltransferase GcvT [Oligoflexia bacterium]|nr:glycine cleavage system aminomethyltransferase GcvT [Oligoflexia bacterium]HMP48032.1 glycine cleavage system aminomethyltransferase GcvT [Oligoflexia bacterium]
MKELPLREFHKSIGGRLVPFAGWNMPVMYSGIKEEHNVVRTSAGIFDVSHMGQILVKGPDSTTFLSYISTNDPSKLSTGRAQYGLVLNREGGVIDDIIIYRLSGDSWFVCVNASNVETVYKWFGERALEGNISLPETERRPFSCEILDLSSSYGQFAVQGPFAMKVLGEVFGSNVVDLKPFNFLLLNNSGFSEEFPCILARTGYSGEDGAEIFFPFPDNTDPSKYSEELWIKICTSASQMGINLIPCGLGARDTLRLEAALPLHGHEIREDITPLSAGLERFVKFDKGFFIGAPALEQQKQLGISPVLIGLEIEGSGIARSDCAVMVDGKTVGWITSGTMTPTIGKAIAMALVLRATVDEVSGENSSHRTKFTVQVRGKELSANKVPLPFYKRDRKSI